MLRWTGAVQIVKANGDSKKKKKRDIFMLSSHFQVFYRWMFVDGRLLNMKTKLCLTAFAAEKSHPALKLEFRDKMEKNLFAEMSKCKKENNSDQWWEMQNLPDHIESNKFGIL
eukprot:m.292567 g.292567  ORF g.292567 m.292567 type:complete len:113 (-) comp16387_c0_seq44:2033-2371(-)